MKKNCATQELPIGAKRNVVLEQGAGTTTDRTTYHLVNALKGKAYSRSEKHLLNAGIDIMERS